MITVFVNLPSDRLDLPMETMRVWLDAHQFEPAEFRYRAGKQNGAVELDFKAPAQAAAFAKRFAGQMIST